MSSTGLSLMAAKVLLKGWISSSIASESEWLRVKPDLTGDGITFALVILSFSKFFGDSALVVHLLFGSLFFNRRVLQSTTLMILKVRETAIGAKSLRCDVIDFDKRMT